MDSKVVILLIILLFAILIAFLQASGIIDLAGIYNRVVKQEKPEEFPEIEFLQPPAHGYHPVYYDGENYWTYVVFKSTEYLNYTPSVVTSFPLKSNPILLDKYQDKDGRYVYELLLKSSKINKVGATLRLNQYVVTFYPTIEDIRGKWGIEIVSPVDGSEYNLDTTQQITVYVVNKYDKFTYSDSSILLGGSVATIKSSSIVTGSGEQPLTSGVVVNSGDILKFVIDISTQTAGEKTLTVNVDTQNHGTLSDSVKINLVGGTGTAGIKITDVLVDGQSASRDSTGTYIIPIDNANDVTLVTDYTGQDITATDASVIGHSTPVNIGIRALKHLRKGKIKSYFDPFNPAKIESSPLYLSDGDNIHFSLSKVDLEKLSDGNVHTITVKLYNSETGEWLEDSITVKIQMSQLRINLLKPADTNPDDSQVDEVIRVNELDYGLYKVDWKNSGEREIYVSEIIVKLQDTTDPTKTYLLTPATPVEGTVVNVGDTSSFYINLIKAGIPDGVYKVTLIVSDMNQATPVEAPEHPNVQIINPNEKIQLTSPQPYATIDATEQSYINAVVFNSGQDPIQIRTEDGIRFYWIPLDDNGQPVSDTTKWIVVTSDMIPNYNDIITNYNTFNPGQSFMATVPIPNPDQLDKPIKNYMLAVEVYKPDSSKLSDSVQPVIIYKKCSWSFTIESVTDDAQGGDPLNPPDVWDKTAGVYKTITLVNTGSYPIKYSANDITVILDDGNGNTISLPVINKGSLSTDSGTNYWYPGKTLQIVTSVIGIPSGTYTLRISLKNYMYCADTLVKEVSRTPLEIQAPESTCDKFLTVSKPDDNTYIDLSQLDSQVGKAGIFRVNAQIDTVGLSQQTGNQEFKIGRVSVILKDSNGNIVYMFTPDTEILNYNDVVSKTYTITDNTFELIIDGAGLVSAGLLDKPLTLEVSVYLSSIECYDFVNKQNIYFIYPDNKVFEAVFTKYAVPQDASPVEIQYADGGAITSPTQIDIPDGVHAFKIYAVNDAGDYNKNGVQSTMPALITKVYSPRFYDPVHRVTYYGSYCQGTPTNEGLLWAKLYEISWCIDTTTIPPTDIDNTGTGQTIVPDGYTLTIPLDIKDTETGKVTTVYLSFPHIHIHSQQEPTSGFTPQIVNPVKVGDNYPKYPLFTKITIAIKRPSTEQNAVDVDLSSLKVTLRNAYTGEEYTFSGDDLMIYDRVLVGGTDTIPSTKDAWEQWGSQEEQAGHFKTITEQLQNNILSYTLQGGQDSYIVLRIDTTKYNTMLPSYYTLSVDITANDHSNTATSYIRQVSTTVKLINDDGTGNPVIWYEYPMNGQEITLNIEPMFAGGTLYAGSNLLDYLPALKDLVNRYGLNYYSRTIDYVNDYFRDYWARQNYRPAIQISQNDVNAGKVPQDIASIWYWELKGKDIDTNQFQKYTTIVKINDIYTMKLGCCRNRYYLTNGFYDPAKGQYLQIFQSVLMAVSSDPSTITGLDMKGVIRSIMGDMAPDRKLTIQLMAKPKGYNKAPDDPELFPTITFKLNIVTSTKPYIEYPNGNTVKVGIADFSKTYDWNELTQLIGNPQGDLASDLNMIDTLKQSIFFYSYGDDSYSHNTYVKIFNPAGVNTILEVKPINTVVDPIYLQAFQDVGGNTFSIAPGIIMRETYSEWEPANTNRQKVPLEIYYYPVANGVTYQLTLKDAVTGEVYDTKQITIIPYNTATTQVPYSYIQPQQNDNIDVWKLSDQILLEQNTQQTGSKVYAGATTQLTKPLYFWSYIQSKITFKLKDIKVYIDGNPVQVEGIRIIDTNANDIPFTKGMKITPGMSIGAKIKIGTVTATIETGTNGGKRIIDRSFTYEYPIGHHKIKIVLITTEEKNLYKETTFNIYNSQGKHYLGKIIYPRPLSQVTTNEYYNNQLVVKFENTGKAFTYSSINVKVNGNDVKPNAVKVIQYQQVTGTAQDVTSGTVVNPGDLLLIYLPTDKLFTSTINKIEITITTQDGSIIHDKTVFVLSDAFYLPYKSIKILNIKDSSFYNTYYTDNIIVQYRGYKTIMDEAEITIDNTFTNELIPDKIIRGDTTLSLSKGSIIQDGDILIFKLKDKNSIPTGYHIVTVSIKHNDDTISDTVSAIIYNQDWGTQKAIHISSPDKKDYYLQNKPIIITVINEKAPFTLNSYTIKIDGQTITPQKALKLGTSIEQLNSGTSINSAETLYFEIDPTSIQGGVPTGSHTIEVDITTSNGETITDTKTVFLYDPMTPTNIIILNPSGDLPNLISSLIALGGWLAPTPDGKYVDIIMDEYPVSFTWDKGEAPMDTISITIDGTTFTPNDGIDKVIVKTRDGAVLEWTPSTANSIVIRSGDVVTAYINFASKNLNFHLLEFNSKTNEYDNPVEHSLGVDVTSNSLKYHNSEKIGYTITSDIHWKSKSIRYLSYLEEWTIKTPIYYQKESKHIPKPTSGGGGFNDGDGNLKVSCNPEYKQCCMVSRGEAQWTDFYKDPADILSAKLVSCLCDTLFSLFGSPSCGCCGETGSAGSGFIIPDNKYGRGVEENSVTKTYCAGTLITNIKRLTNYVITSGSTSGSKVPAGTGGWQYVVNGQQVEISPLTIIYIEDKDPIAVIKAYGIFINGYNPYVMYSYSVSPYSSSVKIKQTTTKVGYSLPSDLPIINANDGQSVTERQFVSIDRYFIKGQCESDMSYRIKKLLDYTIRILIPDYQFDKNDINYNDGTVKQVLGNHFIGTPDNLLQVLPYIDYPTEAVPYWLYPSDFKAQGFMIPIQVTVYTSNPGETVTDFKLYYDRQLVPSDKYLPIIIKKTASGIEVIPYDQWDKKLDQITQFYIIYIPDRFEMGRHSVTVELGTADYGNVGMIREFDIKPAFSWQLLLTSVPDVVYKEYGTTLPVYIKNKGMSFRYGGIKVYIDGNEVPISSVKKLQKNPTTGQDELVSLNVGDYVDTKDMIMFPLDIGSLSTGKHELKVVITTGFSIDISLTKEFTVENEMHLYKISLTSPSRTAPLLYDSNKVASIFVKNEGDAITYGGAGVTLNNKPLDIQNVYKVTSNGLVQINVGDTINSQEVLKIVVKLPNDYNQELPLENAVVSVGVKNNINNEILKDSTLTQVGSEDVLKEYKIVIQSPTPDTTVAKSIFSTIEVYIKNSGRPIITDPSNVKLSIDGAEVTANWVKVLKNDGTTVTMTGQTTVNTGELIVAQIPISNYNEGTHLLSVDITAKGENGEDEELIDSTTFTIQDTPKNYEIRISSPKWHCPLVLGADMSTGVPVYITNIGETMTVSSISVFVNGEEYKPSNIKVGQVNAYIDFTPGTVLNHFDIISFTVPQSYFINMGMNLITVKIQTSDGSIVSDTVKFALITPTMDNYIKLVRPQDKQTYIRAPLKVTSVTYHTATIKVGSTESSFKRADNKFLYGVNDVNTLIKSYNELISLINKYPVGGKANANVKQLISSNSDVIRPFIQMIEWDADIEDLHQFIASGASFSGFENFLQFYIDAGKFIFTDYDPNIVMRFKIVNPDAEKFGKVATISWRGMDGKVHSTNLILYKGIVVPEEITLFDFVLSQSVGKSLKVTVPIFYGFDYSGNDKYYDMQVEIYDKSVGATLDKKVFKLKIIGKRFSQPVGFRLVYPMSIYNDYYKTSYTPISEWIDSKLPVQIEWYDYLYKFDPRSNNWFMGINWVDSDQTGHIIGIGKDDNGYYYKYDDSIAYTTDSDISTYLGSIPSNGLVYNNQYNEPARALLWLPSLNKFKTVFGWDDNKLQSIEQEIVENSYTTDGKVGTNFVFIVYTATKVDDNTISEYNFADKGHIIWGYTEIKLKLEPKYMDVDNDKIPDYIITPDDLQQAMSSPVWQNNDYYQNAYNSCGDAQNACMVNGFKLDKLAHKQVVFTLENLGSLIYQINDIRRDLKFSLTETTSGTTYNNIQIFVLNAPSALVPRSKADIWVIIDDVPTGKYTMSASLNSKAYTEDWLRQFQEVTGIDLNVDSTKEVNINTGIPITKCGSSSTLCMYYNRMVELKTPANGQEIHLEDYHNSLPFKFLLYLDGEYILKEFKISLIKESKDSIFYLRYFDPQGGVVQTEELIQQGQGQPTYIMDIQMNPNDRTDWTYSTKIISSTGEVTEQQMPKDIASIFISNNLGSQPIVGDMDSVSGQLGVPNYPSENIGLNIISLEVVLENPNTHETVTLKDANADVTIGRKVQPKDNILEIASPTTDATGTDAPVQVVDTCVQALQLMMMPESDKQIYSKDNSNFIKQTLEGTCDMKFTEDYVNKKIKYIDVLPVGEFKVVNKIYDPTCNCVYELPPEAWEHMRPPIDSGITGAQSASSSGSGNNNAGSFAGIMASGDNSGATSQAVTKQTIIEPFNMKQYSIINAGGYAWFMNQTTIRVGYGNVNGQIYLDNALNQMLSGRAVWNRASWYIMLTKNTDGTGTITIKYAGHTYSVKITNMAEFMGIDNNAIIPVQGYLYFNMPSIKQIIDKIDTIASGSTKEALEFALEHIESELVTIDSSKIAMFTYTGNAQGEDYNEYSVSIAKPDKFIKIINIPEGSSSSYNVINLNGYTLPVSVISYGTEDITISSAHIELYDNGNFATTPYIVETDDNVAGKVLQASGSPMTINFNLKNYLLKTSSHGNIKKLVLVITDDTGEQIKYPIYYIKAQFTDYAFTVVYPDSNVVDAIVNPYTNNWYIPIKLKATYEYLDDTTGEVVHPPVKVDKIVIKLNGNTVVTKTYNKEFNYGDAITFWANLGNLGTLSLVKDLTIEYTYSVDTGSGYTTGTQPPTQMSVTLYPTTGLTADSPDTSYIFSDFMFGGTTFTLTNELHKDIIQPVNKATPEFQLSDYTVEYTIEVDNTVVMHVTYKKDKVLLTEYINGYQQSYILDYKNPVPTIDQLQAGESMTYLLYGLNDLQASSKSEYNNIVNGLLNIASQMSGKVATIQFKFTFTYTSIYNGDTVTSVYQTPKKMITLKDYDPIISYPTSNSLLYIPKQINQFSIIMYNIGKKSMTIDLSSMNIKMGNIDMPIVYVKDSQGNIYTTGTITLSDAGGTNPYIIIRVDTTNVIDGIYNLNINFNTQEAGTFTLQVTNIQIKKVDEVNIFEPEWDVANSDYTATYGSTYITLPMIYPPENYGTFGDIEWKDTSNTQTSQATPTTGTQYFQVILYRIEPSDYDTPEWAGRDKAYSTQDGSLTGVLIDSLNNNDNIISQGETLGVMIAKTSTVTINGQDIPYSDFFKGINKINLIYTNPNSDYNNMIIFTKYFSWGGSTPLWLDFKFNGWYFEDFNWRIPVEIDPTAQIDSPMLNIVIKITLDVSGNQELKNSLETMVDTDNDGVPDTPAWQTKQVGIRVTYYDPAFEDINGDGTPDPAEAEVPFYVAAYDGNTVTIYIEVPIIKPSDVGQRILNIYYYGSAYTNSS